jgi:hypothetical protein
MSGRVLAAAACVLALTAACVLAAARSRRKTAKPQNRMPQS